MYGFGLFRMKTWRAKITAAQTITEDGTMSKPYGNRRAMLKDSAENIWQIATHNQTGFR